MTTVRGRFFGWSPVPGTDRPELPSQDAFWRAPANLAAHPPGTILRSRPVKIALMGVVPQQVSAWQLLYRSNDLHGQPEVAVTTVMLPNGAARGTNRPLLAFQSAIDAVTDRCAPSYALRRSARALGSVTQLEWMLVANALRRGWAVSIADHQGLHGNFGVPREPGYRVLDGIRSALRFGPLGLNIDTPVAVWGYSGGGMASSWVAEMAPTYAPELDIVGAVLGAPVGDPGEVFARLNGGYFAGFGAIVIAAIRRIYPILDRIIDENLSPEGLEFLEQAARMTPVAAIWRLASQNVDDFLRRPLAEILAEPDLQSMLGDLRLGHRTPACPLLVIQPVHDQVVHLECVEGQVDRYRRGGATVTYVRDSLSEHFTLLPLSTPMSLNWLEDRIAGIPVTDTRTHTFRSVALTLAGIRGMAEIVATGTRVVLGLSLHEKVPRLPEAPSRSHAQPALRSTER
ncbi:lipase family protein [Nocardia sp. bgisy134]|uniref:lipase family protein n=1 Tax=Nocardia sp. bgisy134 TaxID=3413789 RepID=UPI003D748BE9